MRNEIVKSIFWSAVEKYSGMLIQVIVTMILARILSPKEFGIVAIATILVQFFSILSTMAIGPAIIQRKDLTKEDLNNLFTFSIIIGLILSLCFFATSQLIASFFNNEILKPICQILAITLFFSTINMVSNALMYKNKKFKDLARRTLILQLASGIISIIAAIKGLGVYTLLISPTLNSIGIFLYNRTHYPVKVNRKPSLTSIKKIYSFSVYQFLFEIICFFGRNMDKLIIGKFISTNALGYYEKSFRLMQMPLNSLSSVIQPVIQPYMSDIQHNVEEISKKHNKIIYFLSTLSVPIAVTLTFLGYEIIRICFGPNWNLAIPSFQIFCLCIPTQMMLATSGAFFQSCNKTNLLLLAGTINTCIVLVGYTISSYFFQNINAVAASFTISSFIGFFISYYVMYKYAFKTPLLKMIKLLINPLGNGILLAIILYIENHFLEIPNEYISLIIKLMISFLITVIYIQLSKRYDLIKKIKDCRKM